MGKKKDKKSKKKKKSLEEYLTASGVCLDFERPLVINGKATDYSITRAGDVISYKMYGTDEPRALVHMKNDSGYHMVNLLIDGEKEKTYYVHVLVATTFIPNPDNKPQVNHKDGNKDNNYDRNLEWATESENIQHAYTHNLINHVKGEKHHFASITEEQAKEICELLQQNELSMKEIASKIGCGYSVVKKIKNKQRWTHISKDYDFSKYINEKERKKKNNE